METGVITPTHAGQICKILNVFDDENPDDVLIISEDPSVFDEGDYIYVVNLKDFQRNIRNPCITPQISIAKNELTVISDSLEQYILSWNR